MFYDKVPRAAFWGCKSNRWVIHVHFGPRAEFLSLLAPSGKIIIRGGARNERDTIVFSEQQFSCCCGVRVVGIAR